MPRLVFLGDSIIAAAGDPGGGWAGRVSRQLGSADGVGSVNLGVPGATARDLLADLPRLLNGVAAGDICVVGIGINDLHPLARDGRDRARVLADLAAAYASITDLLAAVPAAVVFVELTPVDEAQIDPLTGRPAGLGRSNADIDAVNRLLAGHCHARGLPLIEVCARLRRAGVARVLADGLHPAPGGHDLIAETARPVLGRLMGPASPGLPD